MRRALRLAATLAVLVIVALVAFEAYALWRAQQRTPQVLAAGSQGELSLDEVGQRRLAMLVKIEDPGFWTHRGVDFSTPGAGMTSITQSLVKRFYFERFQPGFAMSPTRRAPDSTPLLAGSLIPI